MILVTGASGKTGKSHRSGSGGGRSAGTRHGSRAGTGKGTAADRRFRDPRRRYPQSGPSDRSMEGISAVYHICPNVSKDEFEIGEKVINTARKAGVEHFVYHSVLHPQIEDMPHHWLKMRVEELLFKSGLNFTILQPVAYMQNVQGYWNQI